VNGPAEPSNLDAWVLATAPRATAYARSLLGNPADAEDIVQDCYCRLLAKAHEYDLLRDGLRLLLRSITNACINLRTRRKPWLRLGRETDDGPALAEPADERTTAPLDELIGGELRTAIGVALQKLPPQQRAAIQLKSLGHTQQEIAEILEVSPTNAGVLIFRARQALSVSLAGFLHSEKS
jgi:RNA polymerase sigma-70 factor (ECF subfamily)